MFEMIRMLLDSLAVSFDLPILDWIAANLWCPALDIAMPIITVLGDAGIFWICVSVLLMFFKKYRKIGLGMAFAMVMGLVVCNMILKPGVARIRPYDFKELYQSQVIPLLIEKQHDFAFPSGHTIASFEACTVLMLGDKKLGIPATLLAILIAFSRLYLYVHYPTDVIASVILGTIFGIIGYLMATKIHISNPFKKGKFQR